MDTVRKRKLELPEILLISAGCFAMAAIGFFIAVYFLQLKNEQTNKPVVITDATQVSSDDKARQLQALSQTDTQTEAQVPANTPVPSSQASQDDALAAQKLKMLQQMSGK